VKGAIAKSLLSIPVALSLVACATGPTQYAEFSLNDEQHQAVLSQPVQLQPAFEQLYKEGRRNEVLNYMEIGSQAFKHGYYGQASSAFDAAINNINSVYADNAEAQKARSLWHEEGRKDFKGEPYERAMVFFYRGLIYLRDGDYENARASFINGIMQDAFAEEEQNRSDFALFLYLAGWSAQKMGAYELAKSHFEELKIYRPDIEIPKTSDDVLVVAATGLSPRKLADGVGHYQLVYRRGKGFAENRVDLNYADLQVSAYPVEDLYFQASTRGGRAVDKIIEGKVAFKKTTAEIGTTLTNVTNNSWMAGYAATQGSSGTNTFAALTAVSVTAMALSAKTKPRADTRYWKGLPDTVHVKTIRSRAGLDTVTASFKTLDGRTLNELQTKSEIHFDGNDNGLVYLSSR